MCIRLLGHPKTFPEGKVPTDVGGRGIAGELMFSVLSRTARFVTFFPLPSAQVLPPSPWGKVLTGLI